MDVDHVIYQGHKTKNEQMTLNIFFLSQYLYTYFIKISINNF